MTTTDSIISSDELLERLQWRYATKQFDSTQKINETTWNSLEQALQLSPSSGGLQPWKFVVVTDPAIREQLLPASYGQAQVKDASHLVVFTAKKLFSEADVDAHLNRTAQIRGIPIESLAGFRGMLVGGIVNAMDPVTRQAWAARQTYIALGTLLTSAALLGVDACPMEGFSVADYDRILGLSEKGLTATAICALGFRKEDDPYAALPKVRFSEEELFIHV
jgi:nitroreductase